MRVMEGPQRGTGSQLLCPPRPSRFSEVDIVKAAVGCSCGIFAPVRKMFPLAWVQPRGHVLGQQSAG